VQLSAPATKPQPQFGLKKWLLAPLIPFLFAACGKDSQTPMNPGTPCPDGVTPPCNIENPSIPFTDGQPYVIGDNYDVTDKTSFILTEGGISPTVFGYGFDGYDDPLVDEKLEASWEDNNLPQSLRNELRDIKNSDDFRQLVGNDPRVAYGLLGGFLNPVNKSNVAHNNELRFLADPDTSPGIRYNDSRPSWAPPVPDRANMYTYRNWEGDPNKDIVLISDRLDGADPDNLSYSFINEAQEVKYDDESPPPIAQLCEDVFAHYQYMQNWKDRSSREDMSPTGVIRNDQRFQYETVGFPSTPYKEGLLDGKFGLWSEAKIAPTDNNTLEESLLFSHPSLTVDNVKNAPGSYNPGSERIAQVERVMGIELPNGVYDAAAYIAMRDAYAVALNADTERQAMLQAEYGIGN
jgi:hypothetical protein